MNIPRLAAVATAALTSVAALPAGVVLPEPNPVPTYDQVDLAAVQTPLTVTGLHPLGRLGTSMALGDLDGDGLGDLAVGAPVAQIGGRSGGGVVYLIPHHLLHGEVSPESGTQPVITVFSAHSGDRLGSALAIADFNDDGALDVALGAPRTGGSTDIDESVTILYGPFDFSVGQFLDLAQPAPPTQPRTVITAPVQDILGSPLPQLFGAALAAGDVDGDGIDDLIVGAPQWASGQLSEDYGQVYILYGRRGLETLATLDLLTKTEPTTILTGVLGSRSGSALAAGDFDGDGIDDVCVGAPDYTPARTSLHQGRGYIVYGNTDRPVNTSLADEGLGLFTTLEPRSPEGVNGLLGSSIAAGLSNPDDLADVLIGAPGDGVNAETAGTALLALGHSGRPASISFDTGLGVDTAVFVADGPLNLLGLAVALIDVDGDGWDDAVISAPADDFLGTRPQSGTVYVRRSDGNALPTAPEVLGSLTPRTYHIIGSAPGERLGESVAGGDYSGDGAADLLLGLPSAGANGVGLVQGIRALRLNPRIVRATVVELNTDDLTLSAGDQILLTFDHSVTVSPATIQPGDFYLSNPGATLGTDATISPATERPNVLIVTLGSDFANLHMAGDDPTASTAIDLGASPSLSITDPITGARAVDRGIAGLPEDDPVDLRWRYFGGSPVTIGSDGGSVTVESDPPGEPGTYQYTRHRLDIPAGAIDPGVYVDYRFEALSAGVADQGQTSAVRVYSSQPDLRFNTPATLVVEYLDDEIDYGAGQVEGLVRLLAVKTSGGVFSLAAQPLSIPTRQSADDNTVGTDISSFLTFFGNEPGTFATLPVNPVEERTIFIKPGTGAAAAVVLPMAATDPELNPGADSGYSLQRITFPGFVQTTLSDPARIEVKMRSATLFERTWPTPQVGANLFPAQSGALFVIETRDASGSPISFTQPVNIRAQYIPRADPTLTDLVQFDGASGQDLQMRIVRSRIDTALGPDFQFISDAQTGDTVGGTVSAEAVSPLTDANGKAVWGAVADPSVTVPTITLDEIINHILGVAEITDPEKLDLADANHDGTIDSADIVEFLIP